MSTIKISGDEPTEGANFKDFVSESLYSILEFDKEDFKKTYIKMWNVDEDTSLTFLGKDLTYKYHGKEVVGITGGIITSFKAIAEGSTLIDAKGISVSGPALAKAIDSGNTTTFLNAFLKGNDVITATNYADVFWGGDGNDTLNGLGGSDTLSGGRGIDTLNGGAGNDRLKGEAGNDILKGDAGNDRLEGGAGADKLYGGAGKDTFVFRTKTNSTTAASDRIFDFSQKEKDQIDFSAFDANSKVKGEQDFVFIGTGAFKNAGDLRYEIKGKNTLIQGDVDGNGTADFTIVLNTAVKLVPGDFIL